ncbi:hypothetical protein ABL78_7086 [Leptomonas seymouri]|uniref:Uncharacterized protein n=1 Tax=Leptomonas seymouri TaxID=5684 RepID=A0A0N1IHK2_LEPSE|nr:hypothetical protein ABL78_7086 [Leptomonas seymouri]|eukprot:KPI83868.1 hypothetical protein ABL78_7086 [Leptomonas seymouri]
MGAPCRASSNSLLHDAPRGAKLDMDTPLNTYIGTSMFSADRTGHRSAADSSFMSYRHSASSFTDNMEGDNLNAAAQRGHGDINRGTPPAASSVLDCGGRSRQEQVAAAKRKNPHLFKQLANELRWMHNNLKHGYHSGSTPKHQQDSMGYVLTPQMTSHESFAQDDDEDLLARSVRSSLRRSSWSQSTLTTARDKGKKCEPTSAAESDAKRRKKTRWRTMENGEVEALQEPQTTLDPYSPPSCHYVLLHQKEEDDEYRDGSRKANSSSFVHSQRLSSTEPGVITLPNVYLSDSMLSFTDNDEDYDAAEDSLAPMRTIENDASGLEEVATMGVCPSDRCVPKARCTSSSLVDDLDEGGGCERLSVAFSDGYEEFLFGVAQLQRHLYQLEAYTSELRALYMREKSARLRSKGRGQHLSWTRTMEAANTIHFWRVKVTLLRNFESKYVNVVQSLQHHLPFVHPDYETARSSAACNKSGDTSSPRAQSRRNFLRSSRVIAAQKRHLQALGEQLTSCWQQNANLRDELRQLEEREPRNPHATFATAGMDAEHFIASLPPRISAYGLSTGSAKSSVLSLDAMDDSPAPKILLTAQNLSPSSDDDSVHAVSPRVLPADAVNKSPNLACVTSNVGPLPPCIKGSAAPSSEASTSSLQSSPKRLKYVIQSAAFDADEKATEGDPHSSSLSGHQSHRGSSASRGTTPLTGALAASLGFQQRRKSERHVTFALEPEVLDARPRFSAHSRTIELLEYICMDKRMPWDGLMLQQTALGERLCELAAMQDCVDDEQQEWLVRANTSTPTCTNARAFRCQKDQREMCSQLEMELSNSRQLASPSMSFEDAKLRDRRSKVKPKECAQCTVM